MISDTITPEAAVTELVQFHSLTESPEMWAKSLLDKLKADQTVRKSRMDELQAAGFDVSDQAEKMMDFYIKGEPLWEK